mmetsp:Transcript_33868/g.33401  ORF Transcript_33868/g.33401 Transcript_33868/m.33401 type:complete len:149 (+) Transcript_33868:775-1221(+)
MLMYLVYLTWTALASRPTWKCNRFYGRNHGTVFQILVGLAFTISTLMILAFSKREGGEQKEHVENKIKNMVAEEKYRDEEMDRTKRGGEVERANVFPVSHSTIVFQVFMIFASIYYAMLLTNWGRPTIEHTHYGYFLDEWAGFWAKIV